MKSVVKLTKNNSTTHVEEADFEGSVRSINNK
jgi:hypothetical protein